MRYNETHKAETHARLLKAGVAALRAKGPDGLSVAEVMKAAGLTHGGFYAHFKSKDAFLAETLSATFAATGRLWERRTAGLEPRAALDAYVDQYVAPLHRDHVATGCPVVALSSDLPRQSVAFRRAFDAGVAQMTKMLSGRMSRAGLANAEARAPAVLAAMVGAVTLARTLSNKESSDALLDASRTAIKSTLLAPDAQVTP
tara:strand:+ start:4183 stop:4785 length:603 start_codon:yes stop_codon:yes gene_type:complete